MSPEEGHGNPTTPPISSYDTTPKDPPPTILGHAPTPKKGVGVAFHPGKQLVGTARYHREMVSYRHSNRACQFFKKIDFSM